ncbi:uncharacterized protein BcabD6B2_50010 [Babesia caballi]|uniref:Uncharacterized protein n=1 Tax=Babesia caballi TaxID=5871 RepID=A0AAV4LZC1_BABCB|nr:hypothetical protein BcabD6B2_50010 [Babesia caballi]
MARGRFSRSSPLRHSTGASLSWQATSRGRPHCYRCAVCTVYRNSNHKKFSSVRPLEWRDGVHVTAQSGVDDLAVGELDILELRALEVRKGVLAPVFVVPLREVLARVCPPGLLASLSRHDSLHGQSKQVLEFQGFVKVRVEGRRRVVDLDVTELVAALLNERNTPLKPIAIPEHRDVVLHGLLHVQADGCGGDSVPVSCRTFSMVRKGPTAGEQLCYLGNGGLNSTVHTRLRCLGRLADPGALYDRGGGPLAEDNNVEQTVGTEPVSTVHRCAGSLTRRVEPGHYAVVLVDDLGLPVGGNAAHVVVNGGEHGDVLLPRVHARKDFRRLRDAGELFTEHVFAEVREVEVYVVLLGSAAPPLEDLAGHRSGDDIPGGEVLGHRRVPAHEGLSLAVA